MSHHIEAPNGTHFNFDSDLGTDIHVARYKPDGTIQFEVTLSAVDLKFFIAHWVRTERISKLESTSNDELLLG